MNTRFTEKIGKWVKLEEVSAVDLNNLNVINIELHDNAGDAEIICCLLLLVNLKITITCVLLFIYYFFIYFIKVYTLHTTLSLKFLQIIQNPILSSAIRGAFIFCWEIFNLEGIIGFNLQTRQ